MADFFVCDEVAKRENRVLRKSRAIYTNSKTRSILKLHACIPTAILKDFITQAAQARSMTGDRCYEYNYQESNVLLNLQIIKFYMGTLSVVKITPNFLSRIKI